MTAKNYEPGFEDTGFDLPPEVQHRLELDRADLAKADNMMIRTAALDFATRCAGEFVSPIDNPVTKRRELIKAALVFEDYIRTGQVGDYR